MTRDSIEVNNEQQSEQQVSAGESENLESNESLRFQLLVLSKEILMGRAAMKWETHKQYESVSVSNIVEEADRMYSFIKRET